MAVKVHIVDIQPNFDAGVRCVYRIMVHVAELVARTDAPIVFALDFRNFRSAANAYDRDTEAVWLGQ